MRPTAWQQQKWIDLDRPQWRRGAEVADECHVADVPGKQDGAVSVTPTLSLLGALAALFLPGRSASALRQPESSIKTVIADIGRLVQLSSDLNIGRAFPSFAADIFRRAQDAGYSAEDHAAVVKVLRSY